MQAQLSTDDKAFVETIKAPPLFKQPEIPLACSRNAALTLLLKGSTVMCRRELIDAAMSPVVWAVQTHLPFGGLQTHFFETRSQGEQETGTCLLCKARLYTSQGTSQSSFFGNLLKHCRPM